VSNWQGLRSEIPKKLLIEQVRRVAQELSKPPTMQEFDQNSKLGRSVTAAKKFGGWKQFLTQAGLDAAATRELIPDEDLKQEFLRIREQLGRTPTSEEFSKYTRGGSSTTLAVRFGNGSWPKACIALGYLPPPKHAPPVIGGWNKGIDRVKVDENKLRLLYEQESLSASAIANKLGCSLNTVLRRLRRIGVSIRVLSYQQQEETTPENLLYVELERRRIPFMKYQPIDGLYVVDALIPGARMVIEVDGDYWHRQPASKKRDQRKERYLKGRGYHVLRFWEAELKADVGACVDKVEDELDRIRPRRHSS
jgi:very-short-patch-repair endonuclease